MPERVLDHGYVELIETWGSDQRVIEAARMSTNKGFIGWGPFPCPECLTTGGVLKSGSSWPDSVGTIVTCKRCKGSGSIPGDEGLLRYLYTHNHATPFEMAGMVIEVQAPIFVFREWHRHRTQSYNEMSARYTPLPDVNYVPTIERLLMTDEKNKQAQGVGGILTPELAQMHIEGLQEHYAIAEKWYQLGLSQGVPKELARLVLPVGRYSRMRACTSLRCWLMFLTLRMDKYAQWEIRQFANAVGRIIADTFPRTWELFADGQGK